MQQRHDDGAGRTGDDVGGHDRGPRRVEVTWQRGRAGGQRGTCALGDRPRAIACDADRHDLVLRRIGSAQHVCRSRATDVVFCRLAAEQHHQPDSIACSHAAPTVPCAAMRFRASDVAAATGGRLIGPDVDIEGTGFDTRTLRAGQLFVPLVAERDGHDFIPMAVAAGAAAYLTSRPATDGTAIEVNDTLHALMDLATDRRRSFGGTVIGITGSVGKTSTKDLAWAALAASRRTTANERSFNNEQGLPTTILNTPDDTEVMVVEMGMRGFGEIEALCRIAIAAHRRRHPCGRGAQRSCGRDRRSCEGQVRTDRCAARPRDCDPQRRRRSSALDAAT